MADAVPERPERRGSTKKKKEKKEQVSIEEMRRRYTTLTIILMSFIVAADLSVSSASCSSSKGYNPSRSFTRLLTRLLAMLQAQGGQ